MAGLDDLTSEYLRAKHAESILKANTFLPEGISKKAALDYLGTDEGALYLHRLVEADPNASAEDIKTRAISHLRSGRELPRMETLDTGEALVKFVPAGTRPSRYSSFWIRASEAEAAVAQRRNISEFFGLPIASEAPRYDAYRMTPKVPTQVFFSTVAPTSELDGLVTKPGGAEQALVPNRQLFHEPVYVKSVDNLPKPELAVARAGAKSGLARGLGVLGAAAVIEDTASTVDHTTDLLRQGNVTGAQSGMLHLGGRTLGMVAGAEVPGGLGTLAGIESGPGAFVTGAVGGVVGAIGGDRLVNAIDDYRIYHQDDPQGRPWRYDPAHPGQGWVSDLPPLPGDVQRPVADAALQNRLDYQASTRMAELRMAQPGELADPYRQPASAADPARLQADDWQRDAESGQWTRSVVTGVVGRVVERGTEVASPQRAAELDQAAERTIAHNRANSPQGVAEAYRTLYEQRGWSAFGTMPEAVASTLRDADRTVLASDGRSYTRDAQGQWSAPGMLFGRHAAEGNVAAEIRETRDMEASKVPAAQGHGGRESPASRPVNPPEPALPARLDDPQHPDHAFFQQTRQHVHALDRSLGRAPDIHCDQVASSLAVQARADGLQRIDRIALSDDGTRLWAVQTPPGRQDHLLDLRTQVPTASANTPMEQSAARWPQAMERFQQITQQQGAMQAPTVIQAQMQQGMPGPGLAR
ncbi:hypothetical protein ATSB10_02540 [Dyella thiooxydans]|uniref:X-Tfes XVIPCD domain-containing protein n=1 Tax=Dyella thiooxydans TaxID=445710 RepID=A0A160MY63_9GAMM|nr:hypothetical protein ATSB10_02540 [Dyella thiooxydans]